MPAHSSPESVGPNGQTWKDKGPYEMPKWALEEDVVISGFSGRHPESNSIEELKKNLFDGVDMITEDNRRWKPGLFGTPKRMGKLKEIDKFDLRFFGVHGKQADTMDPMHRLLLEATYEALFDAGIAPSSFKDKNIGVFVGCSERSISSETLSEDLLTGYELLGSSISMLANRVSFIYGFTGPSMAVDTACSSTMHAFNEALIAIKNKRCDAAIVGGATISLSAELSASFARLGLLSKDGTCKVFDATANGYVRSEGVGAILLQKASDAKRCYATILHCKINNDGAKPEGISFPSAALQKQLFKETFSELDLDPKEVDYVEAHGTGTVAGDREESNAIADFFCYGRDTPLLVGSVKSNLGHSEAASGTATISKVIISMEEGVIPPNIYYSEPNPHVRALVDGNMRVVAEKTPWKPGIVAANNFGFGGSNGHIVLKANQKEKPERKERKIPRLALVSGRTEEGVSHIFKKIQEDEFTDEALVLLEDACKAPTQGMRYRGYALVQKPGEELKPTIAMSPTAKRPVWFLFSGMGSQWPEMAKDMMKIPIFANSINLSAQALRPHGVDLLHLLLEANEKELNHVVAPFVTIAAVQIALVDVVKSLGITPDGIVGHSFGELGCAYADGCFSAEQMLITAYWRGKSCDMTELVYGAMAVVGMTWTETGKRCPEGVFPVCNNAEDSVTISGPAEAVRQFVKELNEQNIFAKLVNTCDIAFHSKYVEPASRIMREKLTHVIPNPLPRSPRWVSSSMTDSEAEEPWAQLSSVDYHVHNLLTPVWFKEAMNTVPNNAIVIEFAPHSLLQSIVTRILGPEAIYIGLMNRKAESNMIHCLNGIGRMYTSNLNPSVKNLYDPISYPVPRGTPMLNSLIQWDHTIPVFSWNYDYKRKMKDVVALDTFRGSTYEYLVGHKVDGRILFPMMGYVFLAWKALASYLELQLDELPVIIEDFSIYRASMLPKSGYYLLGAKLFECDGSFRITDGDNVIASGTIRRGDEDVLRADDLDFSTETQISNKSVFSLEASDFYKEMRLRGYEYGPTFQEVISAGSTGCFGKIKWDERWVTFMDALLQIPVLSIQRRGALILPTRVKSIRIDPRRKPEEKGEINFEADLETNILRSGPVEVHGLKYSIAQKRKEPSEPIFEEQVFVPLVDNHILREQEIKQAEEYSQVCTSIAQKLLTTRWKNEEKVCAIPQDFANSDINMEDMLKSDNKSYTLLALLKEMSELESKKELNAQLNDVLQRHKANISQDFFCSQILHERALRAALDVVQENMFSRKMTITEFSMDSTIKNNVISMLNSTSMGMVKFDYVIVKLNEEDFPKGVSGKVIKTTLENAQDNQISEENDLVVAKDLFTDGAGEQEKLMQLIYKSMKAGGFLLFIERTRLCPAEKFYSVISKTSKQEQSESHLEDVFKKSGLKVISKKKDQISSVMYLLRKKESAEPDQAQPLFIDVSDDETYSWVEKLKDAVKENEDNSLNRRIWLTTNLPDSGVVGFMNCLKQEPCGKYLRCFHNCGDPKNGPLCSKGKEIFKKVQEDDLAFNVYKNGKLGMFRHRTLPADGKTFPRSNAFIDVTKRGDLSTTKWIENSDPDEIELPNHSKVQIYYSSLNFRDIMLASGRLPPDVTSGERTTAELDIGIEFVGRDSTGRRVMGISNTRGLATTIVTRNDFLVDIPEHWTMEEASTIPVVYMTSFYSLIIRGRLKRGESILIHSGTGGVGQSAINIAISMGCNIFVTVGSDEKKEYLKSLYPQLKNEILNSRDSKFENKIMKATKGKGVDMVLNSLADDKLQASLRCVANNGRFIEIGKIDIVTNSNLGMAQLGRNITFITANADMAFDDEEGMKEIRRHLSQGMLSGVVRPLKSNVFEKDQAEEAFRFMASGKHIGKVVIKIREEEPERIMPPIPVNVLAVPRTYCKKNKSYIVTGGLGGVGFELASWLVDRGAKKIVLSGRSDIKNNYQQLWIRRWESKSCQVLITKKDISTSEGCEELLREANAMGPVAGIFHLAMVLNDGLFENLTVEDFKKVSLPKVQGVRHLDVLSRSLCPELELFVVFSSISCGRGNPGQSNYGYGNCVMERIVEQRNEQGLPGLAIQWGGIGDVGVVYEKMGGNEVVLKGTVPQRLASCFTTLDRFFQEDQTVVSSFVPVEKAAFSGGSRDDVVAMLCKVLGVKDPASVKPEMTLGELGMDSLMGVEISQVLETEYNTVLSPSEVRQLTINDLKEIERKNTESDGTRQNLSVLEAKPTMIADIPVPKEILLPLNNSKSPENIFFIHPTEGHAQMLKIIARRIKKKVYGLQYTENVTTDSIQNIARQYVEEIKRVQPHGPYNLLGVTYGTAVAFEMALLLQKTDQVKQIISLDGSPITVKEMCNLFLKSRTKCDSHYGADIAFLFAKFNFKQLTGQIHTVISNIPENEAINNIQLIFREFARDTDELDKGMKAAMRIYNLCWAGKNYEPSGTFKGRITLIKPKEEHRLQRFRTQEKDDYCYSEVVNGQVEALNVTTQQNEMYDDATGEITKIINDRL